MKVRLIDIAKKADVSKSTVSRALNDDDRISETTRKKVSEIAKKLNYIPDFRAKAFAKKSTKTIAVVISRIDNLFFAEFVQAFKEEVKKNDYNIILCTTNNTKEELNRYITLFRGGNVDAVALHTLVYQEEIDNLVEMNIPVVCAGNYLVCENGSYINTVNYLANKESFVSCLTINLKEGSYSATKHLIELGHRNIAFVGGVDDRYFGYKEAMVEFDLSINKEYIFEGSGICDLYKLGNKIIKSSKRPTALMCYSDEIAIGVIQSLTRQGVKIPKNISVCGFDNIKTAGDYNPPLTTVDIPKKEMGKKAANLLINKLNQQKKQENIYYDCKLIKRGSTVKI